MPRFHIDRPLAPGLHIDLPPLATRHAVRVLRLIPGDELILFNGQGGEYRAEVLASTPKECRVLIKSFDAREAELPFALTVVQGLSGGDKMDWTVEKAVELGVHAIQPVVMERSIVRLADERAKKRLEHWQSIARAAAEQCGRNRLAHVHPIVTLEHWLATLRGTGLRLVASLNSSLAIVALPAPAPGGAVTLVIGPEGGLAPGEETRLVDAGFIAVGLGPTILRTETAAPAALAMLSAAWSGLRNDT